MCVLIMEMPVFHFAFQLIRSLGFWGLRVVLQILTFENSGIPRTREPTTMGSLTHVETSILNPTVFAPNHSGRQTDLRRREKGDFPSWALSLFIQRSSLSQHCLGGDVKDFTAIAKAHDSWRVFRS